jgi:sugar lactone lactonase YvrE
MTSRFLLPAIVLGTVTLSGVPTSHGAIVVQSTPKPSLVAIAGKSVAGFDDGLGGADGTATFNRPYGLAYDPTGNLYVADVNNHAIRKVDPNGIVTTVAGTGIAGFVDGSGGRNGIATLNKPEGVTSDKMGNLYISDTGNHAIRKIDSNGNVTTIGGTGKPGSVDGNVKTSARSPLFDAPSNLVLDSKGNLFVVDSGHIRKIDPIGNVTTLKTKPGPVMQDDNRGLAIDANDLLYTFADLGGSEGTYAIKKIDSSGETLATWDFRSGPANSANGRYKVDRGFDLRALATDQEGSVFASGLRSFRKITANGNSFSFEGIGIETALPTSLSLTIHPSGSLTLIGGNAVLGFKDPRLIPLTATEVFTNPAQNTPAPNSTTTTSTVFERFSPSKTPPKIGTTQAELNKPELCSVNAKWEDWNFNARQSETENRSFGLEQNYTFFLRLAQSFQNAAPKTVRKDWQTLISGLSNIVTGLTKINSKTQTEAARDTQAFKLVNRYETTVNAKPYHQRLNLWFRINCEDWGPDSLAL